MGGVVPPAMKGAGKAGGGKAKGKGGWGGQKQQWGVPDLQSSLAEALAPAAAQDPACSLEEITKNMQKKIQKMSEKYKKDDRLPHKSGATAARLLVEEFVEHAMGSIESCCYDPSGSLWPWYHTIDFKNPLLLIVLHTFENAKIFARTLKPQLIKYIEDGHFKYMEEQRIEKTIKDVVDLSGIKEDYKKKAIQHLNKSFDEAHMSAPYGGTTNECPELAVLQDFVKGWLISFVEKAAWDVLEDGIIENSRESQVSNVTVLFQNLLDPTVAIVPADIASEIVNSSAGALPPSPWGFIDEATIEAFQHYDANNQPGKKRKMGK